MRVYSTYTKKDHTLDFNEDRHVYHLDKKMVPSVSQLLETNGISDFSMVLNEVLDVAIDYGHAIHEMTQWADEDRLDESTVEEKLQTPLRLWREFTKANIKKWYAIETPVASARYGYAGTPDRVALSYTNEIWLLDIKTGAKTKAHAIQSAGYENAYRENTGERRKIHRITIILNNKLTLVSHGKTRFDFENDFTVFKSALTIHKFNLKGY